MVAPEQLPIVALSSESRAKPAPAPAAPIASDFRKVTMTERMPSWPSLRRRLTNITRSMAAKKKNDEAATKLSPRYGVNARRMTTWSTEAMMLATA